MLGASSGEVPPTVRDAVLARAGRLSPVARGALDAAAVVPDGVEPALLEAVAGADASAVDECVAAGMLRGEGRGLRFRHELARLAVERAVPAGRRVELHRQILAHLVVTPRDEPARLAHHAEEAGMATAVLEHATAAAERAAALGAHREAVDHYATALRFAGGVEDRRLAEVLERYAAECAHTDRATEALQAAERALECWRRLGDREREAALLARRCMYLWGVGRSVEALESAATAVAMLEAAPPGPALATAYTHLASMRMLAREIPGAIEAGGRAIELAERFGEHEQLSRELNAVGAAQWFSDPDQAPLTLGRSLEVAKEHGYDQMAAIAMTNLGSGAGEIRRYALADRWLRDAVAWSGERDLDSNRRYASAWLARCHFEQGRWSEAVTTVARLAAEGVAMSPTRIVALTVLGRLRTRRATPTPGRPWRRPGNWPPRPATCNGPGRWRPGGPSTPGSTAGRRRCPGWSPSRSSSPAGWATSGPSASWGPGCGGWAAGPARPPARPAPTPCRWPGTGGRRPRPGGRSAAPTSRRWRWPTAPPRTTCSPPSTCWNGSAPGRPRTPWPPGCGSWASGGGRAGPGGRPWPTRPASPPASSTSWPCSARGLRNADIAGRLHIAEAASPPRRPMPTPRSPGFMRSRPQILYR